MSDYHEIRPFDDSHEWPGRRFSIERGERESCIRIEEHKTLPEKTTDKHANHVKIMGNMTFTHDEAKWLRDRLLELIPL